MARILLILTILCSLASGYFAYMNIDKKHMWQAQDTAHAAKLKSTQETLDTTSHTLETTKATLTETNTKLDDVTSKNAALQDSLSKSEAKVSDLEKSVADVTQKLATAQSEAATLKTSLGEQSKAAQDAQAKVVSLQSDLRVQTDELDKQKKEAERLADLIARAKQGTMPPGINGKVVSLNTNWNFVVLNIGENQGVVANGELIIYRNKEYIGKVRVANTERNTCVADILVESLKGTIQVGDEAMN